MNNAKGLLITLFTALLIVSGCDSSQPSGKASKPKKKSDKTTPVESKNAAPDGSSQVNQVKPPPSPPGKGTRVIIDISGSMKGFTDKKKVTLETLHRAIDEVLSGQGVNLPLERCLLGTDLNCEKKLKHSDYLAAKLYNAETSRLDRALLRPVKSADDNPAAPPPVDLLDPYHVTMILTDGMQATSGAAGSVTSSEPVAAQVACASGADPNCIGKLLRARADEGYGIWVIFLRLPFKGLHYAERALDNSHWTRILAHVEELNKHPDWFGVNVKAKNLKMDGKTRTSNFTYEGAKPLIIFILSKDHDKGRNVTRDLASRLERENLGLPAKDSISTFELAPYGVSRASLQKVFKTGDQTKKSDGVFIEKPKTAEDKKDVDWVIECRQDSRAVIQVSLSLQAEGPTLPSYVSETLRTREVKPEGKKKEFPAKFRKKLDDRGVAFQTGVDCGTMLASGTYYLDFLVEVERKNSGQGKEDAWWEKQSAENTFEMPERVYGLANLVRTVTEPIFNHTKQAFRIRFKIIKE